MLHKNPLPIELTKVGVTDAQFDHPSAIHGQGHVNRVIFNSLLLARVMGYNDIIPEVWAAAYIHDFARKHDGPCHKHGGWAAYNHLPKYKEFFAEAGVKDFDAVEDAVLRHSLSGPLGENRDNRVCSVLKDADALDRCRLGDLDQSMLRLELSRFLVSRCETLYQQTKDQGSWGNVWDKAVALFNPHIGLAEKHKPQFNPSESHRDRMLRRVSKHPHGKVVERARGWLMEYESMKDIVESCPIGGGTPVIYMSDEALEGFKKDLVFKTVWETGKTWHDKFGDNPLDARAFNELRLFGEVCGHMAHGSLFHPGCFDNDKRLREMYGKNRVHLSKEVLESASFTINDSQTCIVAFPWDPKDAAVMLTTAMIGHMGEVQVIKDLFFGQPPNFMELQFHRHITWDLVTGVE